MTKTFAKTKTKLMVLLMVVAVVALAVALAFSAFSKAGAATRVETVSDANELTSKLSKIKSGELPADTILKLDADFSVLDTVEISCTVTLDLNGHQLRYTNNATVPVLRVTGGNFTLMDSDTEKSSSHSITVDGKPVTIKGGLVSGGKDGGIIVSAGSFTFNGGTIAGNSTTVNDHGGGVTFMSPANDFTLKRGASISYNSAVRGGGVYMQGINSNRLLIEGGEISNNTADLHGGGVFLGGTQGLTLQMNGGEISNNTATNGNGGGIYVSPSITAVIDSLKQTPSISGNSAQRGGGIYAENAIVNMNDGRVDDNSATLGGGGIYSSNTALTVSGGEVSNNTATYGNGAGVAMVDGGTFTLSNATILGNRITSLGDGAGVYVESGTFTMTSGTITENRILGEGSGAGVFFKTGTLNLSGSPVITENRMPNNVNSNLYLYGAVTFVTVTGEISDTAKIGVSLDSARTFTKGYKTASQNATVKGFFADDSSRSIYFTSTGATAELTLGNGLVVTLTDKNGTTTPYSSIEAAFTAMNASPTGTFSMQLLDDIETSTTLTISVRNFTLDLNGHMLHNTTTTNNAIVVTPVASAPNINFTLKDSRPMAGPHEIEVPTYLYETNPYVTSPTVNVYGGVIAGGYTGIYLNVAASQSVNLDFISGTIAGAAQQGIYMTEMSSGTKTITTWTGAAIRYNALRGAFVFGTLNVNGGDFSYNGAHGLTFAGTLNLKDGKLTHNGDTGLWLSNSATLNMEGGDISYNGYGPGDMHEPSNYTDSAHAGITLAYSTSKAIISGGTITHNAWEGIVTQQTQSNISDTSSYMLQINGGEISYNGHEGVRLTNTWVRGSITAASQTANAKIENATISYNGYSGIYTMATLKVKDTTISYNGNAYYTNSALSENTSNIHCMGGNVTLDNCVLKGAVMNGIRIWKNTVVNIYGGEISGNLSSGINLYDTPSVTLHSGEIKENAGVGGMLVRGGTFTMEGGSIHDNYLDFALYSSYGAGINVVMNSSTTGTPTVNLNGGEIYNNKGANGAALYIRQESNSSATVGPIVTMKDGFSIHDNVAEQYGGAVYIDNGKASTATFNMQGGRIYNNSAMYGGGVAVKSNAATYISKFAMSGGEITGNTAVYGGGVYYGANGTVEMSGAPYILNNTDLRGNASNLYMVGEQKITVTGTITHSKWEKTEPDTNKIGISLESAYSGRVLTQNYNKEGFNNNANRGFVMDNPSLGEIGINSSSELVVSKESADQGVISVLKGGSEIGKYGTWADAYAKITDGSGDTIKLLADIGVSAKITISADMTLDLNGYMIQTSTGAAIDQLVTVTAGTLNIKDSTYVDGKSTSEVAHWFINPVNEFLAASTDANIKAYYESIGKPAVMEAIYGGIIHGQLYIIGGTVNFDQGYVVNGLYTTNGAQNLTAAGILNDGGTLNFNKDAAVCFNRGMGVVHDGTATTTINGGKIYGNNGGPWGGGMHVGSPNCTIIDCDIYGNMARYSATGGDVFGAGICVSCTRYGASWQGSVGELTIRGGTVHDNISIAAANATSRYWGGAVGVAASGSKHCTLTMSGGSIVDNKMITEVNATVSTFKGGAGLAIMQTNSTATGAMVVLEGGAIRIEGNTLDGVESNVEIVRSGLSSTTNHSGQIQITGRLNSKSRIGLSLPFGAVNYTYTYGYSTAGMDGDFIPFFADNALNCLTFSDSTGELILNAHSKSNTATLTHHAATLAVCGSNGHNGTPEHWQCTLCGRQFLSLDTFAEYVPSEHDSKASHTIPTYGPYDNEKHVGTCTVCGEALQFEEHTLGNWMPTSNGKHVATCTVCGDTIERDCDYEGNQQSNALEHWLECRLCGERYEVAEHNVTVESGGWKYNNVYSHRGTCAECGYYVVEDHVFGAYTYDLEDTEHHYQVCEDCGYKANIEAHNFTWEVVDETEGSYKGTCADCGYETFNSEHNVDKSVRKFNATEHWYECKDHEGCTERFDVQPHNIQWDESAHQSGYHAGTCDGCDHEITRAQCSFGAYTPTPGDEANSHTRACEVCGLEDVNAGSDGHDFIYVKDDADTHWQVCTYCGYETQHEQHKFSTVYNGEQHWEECDDCQRTKNPQDHRMSDWTNTTGGHYKYCLDNCGYALDPVEHDSKWIRDDNGHSLVCDSCGYSAQNQAHSYGSAWYTNAQGEHYQICADCEYQGNKGAHQYTVKGENITQGTHKVTCSVCGDVSSEACTYGSYTYEPGGDSHTATCIYCHDEVTTKHTLVMNSSNADQHWEECECGYIDESTRGAHDFGEHGDLDNCQVCGRALNDPLAEKRRTTRESITAKADTAKAGLGGSQKDTFEQVIDAALDKYVKAIAAATTAEEIEKAEADFNAEVDAIVLTDKKDVANSELVAKADAEREKLAKEDLSADEMAKYEQAIQNALDNAQKNVNNATDVEGVARNLEQGKKDIEQNILKASKEIAKDKVQQEADAKKDEIQDKVDNGEMSQEDADRLKDVIDREAERAQGKIDDATSREEVAEEQQRGDDVIGDIVKNPDPELQEKKSDDRDALDDNAQAKKDEIDEKVKNGELTPEQGKELKDKVDEETKKAQDKVTEATTPEESEKAKNEGMANQDEVSKPDNKPGGDKEPEKDNWFKRLFNSDLPLGYFGIALGVLLFIIIILAIAARKPKKK